MEVSDLCGLLVSKEESVIYEKKVINLNQTTPRGVIGDLTFVFTMDEHAAEDICDQDEEEGERGVPCLRPLLAVILPLGFPFIIMDKLVVEIHALIHFLYSSLYQGKAPT